MEWMRYDSEAEMLIREIIASIMSQEEILIFHVHLQKLITGLFENFSQHGGFFSIPKSIIIENMALKIPLHYLKIAKK